MVLRLFKNVLLDPNYVLLSVLLGPKVLRISAQKSIATHLSGSVACKDFVNFLKINLEAQQMFLWFVPWKQNN